jgi:hypothetical protein
MHEDYSQSVMSDNVAGHISIEQESTCLLQMQRGLKRPKGNDLLLMMEAQQAG